MFESEVIAFVVTSVVVHFVNAGGLQMGAGCESQMAMT